MMGPKQEAQAALFYEFSLEDHVPENHLLRSIDRFVDLSSIRAHLAEFYSHTGRPSIDPELMIRMLLVGYCSGIRSKLRLCEEVHREKYAVVRDFARAYTASEFNPKAQARRNSRLRQAETKEFFNTIGSQGTFAHQK